MTNAIRSSTDATTFIGVLEPFVKREHKLDRSSALSLCVFAAACLVLSGGARVAAQTYEQDKAAGDALFKEGGEFVVDDADPEAHLPSLAAREENPVGFSRLLFQLGDKADEAKQKGDWAAAVRFYRALAAVVPEVSVPFRQLCDAYQHNGEIDKATRSCELALTKRGVEPRDFESYVRLVVSQPGDLTAAQIKNLNTLVEHLQSKQSTAVLAVQLDCEVAGKLRELGHLHACVAELDRRQQPAAVSLPYRWKIAMLENDLARAKQLMESPDAKGVSDEVLQRIQDELQAKAEPAKPSKRSLIAMRPTRIAILVGSTLLVLAIGLYLTRKQPGKGPAA